MASRSLTRVDQLLDLDRRGHRPADPEAGIERGQLQRGRDHSLHVLVADQAGRVSGREPATAAVTPTTTGAAPGPLGVQSELRRSQTAAAVRR